MSTVIDERVVEMRFDNRQFESGVATTMSTLDKFKKSLDLSESAKGLEDVGYAAKKVDLSPLSDAAHTVGLKFDAMYTMADQALRNITNSAMFYGKKIISSLTIDQISSGWGKYGDKTASVQTIMNATGKSIDDVNGYLNKLMWFSDETSYGFTDMTGALAQLTSAGGDIEKLIPLITGVANATAYAGKGASEFSRVMYNLNQSYSAGALQYMDWRSLELAGVGSKELKQVFIDTAESLGKIEKGEVTISNFAQTLKDKWADTEVMEKAFGVFGEMTEKAYEMVQSGEVETASEAYAILAEKYDGVSITAAKAAQEAKTFSEAIDATKDAVSSGWMKSFEIIFGNYEEAKVLWTDLANSLWDVFASGAEDRNAMLQDWKDLGGRDDLIESFWNIWEGLESVITPIKEALTDIFPPTTANQLKSFTGALKELTEKLTIGEKTADNLKRTFKGVFAVVKIFVNIFKSAFSAVSSLFGTFGELGGGVLDFTANIGDLLVRFSEFIEESNIFGEIFDTIATVIKNVIKLVSRFIGLIKDKVVTPGWEALKDLLEHIAGAFGGVGDAANGLRGVMTSVFDSIGAALEKCSVFKLIESLWNGIKTITSGIGKVISAFVKGLGNATGINSFGDIFEIINSIISGGIGIAIINFIKSMRDVFGGLGDIIEGISEIFTELGNTLKAFQMGLKADVLIKIAAAIAILSVSLLLLSTIESDKLYDSIVAIAALFASLMGALAMFAKVSGGLNSVRKAATIMTSMSTSVLILAFAMKTVAGLRPEEMLASFIAIAALMGVVVASAKALGSGGNAVIKGATQMVIFAAAIKILATVCEDIAYMSLSEIGKGLLGIAGMAAIMVATAKILSSGDNTSAIKGATQMVIFATAMKILASVCKDISSMTGEEIISGLLGIAGMAAIMIATAKILSSGNSTSMIKGATQMVIFAAAMKILASVCKDMASLGLANIGVGLLGMAGSLIILITALELMPKNLIGIGAGLLIVSAALSVISHVLKDLGNMSGEEVAKSLIAFGAGLGILAIALNAMKGTIGGSASLVVASLALGILAPVLIMLSTLSWSAIGRGLVAIAGAFTVVGLAGMLLQPVIPAIIALAGSLALVGLSVLAVGAGLALAGAGLVTLAAGITALVASLSVGVSVIVSLVSAIIAGIIKGIGDGIVAFCKTISGSASAIGEALIVLVKTICEVVIECIPTIVNTLLQLVAALLEGLAEFTPKIVNALFNFVIGILDSLAENVPVFIQKIVKLIGAILKGVVDALSSLDSGNLVNGLLTIGLMAGIVAALAAIVPLIPSALAGAVGLGIVAAELAIVLAALGALTKIPGLMDFVEKGGDLLEVIGTAIGRFVGGIAGGIAQGFTSSLPQMGSDLSEFMTNLKPFIEGIKMVDDSVLSNARSLVDVILAITGASIMEKMTSWVTGGTSVSDFSSELVHLGKGLNDFSKAIVDVSPEKVTAAATAAKTLADMTSVIPNEGGVVSWFAGENSISKFAGQLGELGKGLSDFSESASKVNTDKVEAAATAAKTLADMTSVIPNEGGVKSWFTGESSISKFSGELVTLGKGLKGFSDATVGIVPDNIIAAANAAKALAEMTSVIPDQGGMVAWFTGESSITNFADDIVVLGKGLKGFSDAVTGVVPENVTSGANAAKVLAEMTSVIPNQGGIVAWFTGESSITKFADEIPKLGKGLKGFSDAIDGVSPENVIAGSNAAKELALMTSTIPNEGGVKAWFTGESSISNFADKLPKLGKGLKGFSDEIKGLSPENVVSASNAAKALAEMTAVIPKEGGIVAWFTGETSISNFADKLPKLGKGLKGFSDSVAEINPENVTAAANAAKSLGQMAETTPDDSSKIITFGENLTKFGTSLKTYFTNTSGISSDTIKATQKVMDAVKDASSMNSEGIKSTATALNDVSEALKKLGEVPGNAADEFEKAMKKLGDNSAETLKDSFKDLPSDMEKIGEESMESFAKGLSSALSNVKKACKEIADGCKDALTDKYQSFYDAGSYLVDGFAKGISANDYKAEAKARAMAKAAAEAAEDELGIQSPSKVGYSIGGYFGMGFVNAVDDYASISYKTGLGMADSAKKGLSNAVSKINDYINSDMDMQPTIRPVLDLSNIRSGAGTISGMLGVGSSVGVLANVGAINSAMNKQNQNGGFNDVVSEINKLRKDLHSVKGENITINGITYDDGSNITEAVKSIVRAARMERRV